MRKGRGKKGNGYDQIVPPVSFNYPGSDVSSDLGQAGYSAAISRNPNPSGGQSSPEVISNIPVNSTPIKSSSNPSISSGSNRQSQRPMETKGSGYQYNVGPTKRRGSGYQYNVPSTRPTKKRKISSNPLKSPAKKTNGNGLNAGAQAPKNNLSLQSESSAIFRPAQPVLEVASQSDGQIQRNNNLDLSEMSHAISIVPSIQIESASGGEIMQSALKEITPIINTVLKEMHGLDENQANQKNVAFAPLQDLSSRSTSGNQNVNFDQYSNALSAQPRISQIPHQSQNLDQSQKHNKHTNPALVQQQTFGQGSQQLINSSYHQSYIQGAQQTVDSSVQQRFGHENRQPQYRNYQQSYTQEAKQAFTPSLQQMVGQNNQQSFNQGYLGDSPYYNIETKPARLINYYQSNGVPFSFSDILGSVTNNQHFIQSHTRRVSGPNVQIIPIILRKVSPTENQEGSSTNDQPYVIPSSIQDIKPRNFVSNYNPLLSKPTVSTDEVYVQVIRVDDTYVNDGRGNAKPIMGSNQSNTRVLPRNFAKTIPTSQQNSNVKSNGIYSSGRPSSYDVPLNSVGPLPDTRRVSKNN